VGNRYGLGAKVRPATFSRPTPFGEPIGTKPPRASYEAGNEEDAIVDKQVNFAPVDRPATDPKEAEQLDLEAAAQPAPTVAPADRSPSLWRSLKRLFK
jgi:hypothetical protein